VNPNTATNEELRDWLAIRQGWTRTGTTSWRHTSRDDDGATSTWCANYHPIPNTIDAAHDCFPDGWAWYCTEIEWKAHPIPTISATNAVCVDRTADEATDRFRLAVKAIMAMEEGK
jgi:hypothetical protein